MQGEQIDHEEPERAEETKLKSIKVIPRVYEAIVRRKGWLERERGRLFSISEALDELLILLPPIGNSNGDSAIPSE